MGSEDRQEAGRGALQGNTEARRARPGVRVRGRRAWRAATHSAHHRNLGRSHSQTSCFRQGWSFGLSYASSQRVAQAPMTTNATAKPAVTPRFVNAAAWLSSIIASRSPFAKYVSGKTFAMACRYDGMMSIDQKVPERNIIGKAMAFPSPLAASGSLTKPARVIPIPENMIAPTTSVMTE